MNKKAPNPILLTYGDSTIRKSDFDCFEDGKWLNDNCISFYYEYLAKNNKSNNILLLDPSLIAFLYFEDELDDAMETFGPLEISKKKFILIPINDKEDKMQAIGGSHWGLLVYNVVEEKFLYFDSMNKMIKNALPIAVKLKSIKNEKEIPEDDVKITQIKDIPQQANSFDCGMYLLMYSEALYNALDKGIKFKDHKDLFSTISEKSIKETRKKIQKKILELSKSN